MVDCVNMTDPGNLALQALIQARSQTWQEYVDERTQAHNRWLRESDAAWRTSGVILRYPTHDPYPSDQQILARAELLLTWLQNKNTNKTAEITTEQPAEQPTQQAQSELDVAQPAVHEEVPIDHTPQAESSVDNVSDSVEQSKEPEQSAEAVPTSQPSPTNDAAVERLLNHHAGHMIFGLHSDNLISLAKLMGGNKPDSHLQTVQHLERMIDDIRNTAS